MQIKTYDLEERTFTFAKSIRIFLKTIKNTSDLRNDKNQLARSSGSVGANYIEANQSLSKKDFLYRLKVCRKEAKESAYWLKLLTIDDGLKEQQERLIKEAEELVNIFGSIVNKIERNK